MLSTRGVIVERVNRVSTVGGGGTRDVSDTSTKNM